MARTKKTETVVVTRAEKKDATKNLIKEALAESPLKHNELIESVAKTYTERFGSDTDNANDVKGRVGSVLDIMKKESEVAYDGGRYALKARLPMPAPTEAAAQVPAEATEEKPKKKSGRKAKTVEKKDAEADSAAPLGTVEKDKEKPAKKTVKKTAKKADEKLTVTRLTPPTESKEKEKQEEKDEPVLPLPPAPLQPIAPVVPISPEVAPEPMPEKTEKAKRTSKKAQAAPAETATQAPAEATEEKPKKKSVRKTKAAEKKDAETDGVAVLEKVEKTQEQPQAVVVLEEKQRAPQEEKEAEVKNSPVVRQKAEIAPKTEVMDMSFLFGAVKPAKAETKSEIKTETKPEVKTEEKPQAKPAPAAENGIKPVESKPQSVSISEEKQTKNAPQKTLAQPQNGEQKQGQSRVLKTVKKAVQKPLTADEKLRESFLKKLRSLGGDYFEYYSVYLLEKYSRKNGRRLESLRICGGGRDGGIDGEIELTDKLGFRETIYIQSKNWDPDRGDERLWVVGETLLQQFIGACACKQAKDGKQHARGIFITTSNFTADAKRILDVLSDKVVGYDGNDLYEAAKECQFGLLYENGNWKLDEKLLSGVKAFFAM